MYERTRRRRGRRRLIALVAGSVAVVLMAGCSGEAGVRSRQDGGTTTTTLGPRAFVDAVRGKDLDALVATFAHDIELHSPVLAEPFVGKERVSRLFGVLVETFEDIDVTHELEAPGEFALVFDARVGEEPIQIVDLLEFDDAGRIRTFTVTARPLAGINALAMAVAPHLADIG